MEQRAKEVKEEMNERTERAAAVALCKFCVRERASERERGEGVCDEGK